MFVVVDDYPNYDRLPPKIGSNPRGGFIPSIYQSAHQGVSRVAKTYGFYNKYKKVFDYTTPEFVKKKVEMYAKSTFYNEYSGYNKYAEIPKTKTYPKTKTKFRDARSKQYRRKRSTKRSTTCFCSCPQHKRRTVRNRQYSRRRQR